MRKIIMGLCVFALFSFLYFFAVSNSKPVETIINVTIEQYCRNGVPENGMCKVITSVPAETACPDGYPLNPESKFCERTVSMIAEMYLTCDEGFKHYNGKCFSEVSYPKNENGTCDSQYMAINGECKEVRYHYYAYKCPSGILNETTHKCDFPDQRTPVVTCPEGYITNQENLSCDIITYEEPSEREVTE